MNQQIIEDRIIDAVLQSPVAFTIGKRQLTLYPPSLGKVILLNRLKSNLEISEARLKMDGNAELLHVCHDKKDIVLRMLAYSTMLGKNDIFNERRIQNKIKYFDANLSFEDMSTLLFGILQDQGINEFDEYLGLPNERKERERIASFKKNKSSSVSFGGKSIYGTLIDYACQRYGWTMDYVVWGISYANLKMLISDAVTTIELSKEDAKALRISQGGVISADDPNNIDKIRSMFGD